MHGHDRQVMVVEASPAQVGVLEVKAQGLDQVQLCTGDSGQTNRVTGITRNFRGIKKNLEHPNSLRARREIKVHWELLRG